MAWAVGTTKADPQAEWHTPKRQESVGRAHGTRKAVDNAVKNENQTEGTTHVTPAVMACGKDVTRRMIFAALLSHPPHRGR